MNINKKTQNIALISVLTIGIIGLMFGSFFDTQISNSIGNRDNLFGILFTAFGTMVSLTIGCFAGSALYFCEKKWSKFINIFLDVIGIAAFIILTAYEVRTSMDYASFPRMEENATTYKALIAVLICLINLTVLLFTRRIIKKIDVNTLVLTSLTMLFMIGFSSVFGELIKNLSNRARPYEVQSGSRPFTQWYQFNFDLIFKGVEHSFVSGHAVNSACSITLLPLLCGLFVEDKKQKVQIVAISCGILYAAIVMISRMLVDMHYLSDVSGGLVVTLLMQLIVINLIEKVIKVKKEVA